jgi:hypothetical protein
LGEEKIMKVEKKNFKTSLPLAPSKRAERAIMDVDIYLYKVEVFPDDLEFEDNAGDDYDEANEETHSENAKISLEGDTLLLTTTEPEAPVFRISKAESNIKFSAGTTPPFLIIHTYDEAGNEFVV